MTENELILHVTTIQPTPNLDAVIALVDDLDGDYTNLIAALITHKVIKKPAEFASRLRTKKRALTISSQLGSVPETTDDLIKAILNLCAFRIDATNSRPLTWVCPIRHDRIGFDAHTLIQAALEKNRNLLSNQFRDTDIRNEVELFCARIQERVRSELVNCLTHPREPFDWTTVVRTCFDTTDVSEAITIAMLQKTIWQIKRKMVGLPVTEHVMPVIYGSQGKGKTMFVTRMLEVLGSLWTITDFGRLTDNREASLFDHYALFLDEMHKADRAAMDAVKAVITRERYSFRPMGTNNTITRPQNSSFIGCSNKLLQQLINDPTGNRRFFQLDFNNESGPAEWEYVNSIDFHAMWCSVDHTAADPTAPYKAEMEKIREQSLTETTVGLFIRHLLENEGSYPSRDAYGTSVETLSGEVMRKDDLFLAYRAFCDAMRIAKPYELQSFLTELHRMRRENPELCFNTEKTKGFNGWVYTGPQKATIKVVSSPNAKRMGRA